MPNGLASDHEMVSRLIMIWNSEDLANFAEKPNHHQFTRHHSRGGTVYGKIQDPTTTPQEIAWAPALRYTVHNAHGTIGVLTPRQRSIHLLFRLCPTPDFPPAAADFFISSSSNPASISIRSTSSKIGLYSTTHHDDERPRKSVHAPRPRVNRGSKKSELTIPLLSESESVSSEKFSAVVAGTERFLGPVFAWGSTTSSNRAPGSNQYDSRDRA